MELKSVISLFLFLCLLGHLDCTELTVKGGADATLECSGPTDATSIIMRWEKSDLQSEDIVILFRDGRFQENLQYEQFKGRVEMKDPKWKETGDFSVILKHVTTNDAGTYECEAGYDGQKLQSLNRVTLKVENSELTVKGGADATLECSGPTDATLIMMRWEKSDLQSDDYVIIFRDGQFQDKYQHELFKGRVEMKDPKWKETGNFSVILKHVTTNDAGTYECEAGYAGQKPQSLNRVTLKVENSDQPGGQSGGKEAGVKESGSVGLIVGLSVPAVLVGVGAVFIYRTYRRRPNPPLDQGL